MKPSICFRNTSFLTASLFAMTSAFASERSPSMACKFDILATSIRSESAVEDFDPASDKLVKIYPELTEFTDLIPTSVSLKLGYKVAGCREPLVTRVKVTPLIGSSKIDFSKEDTVDQQIQLARQGAKPASKPWVLRDAKLQKLKDSGEVVIQGLPILTHFEGLSRGKWAWSLKFEVSIFEDGREVAVKDFLVDVGLRE